MQESRWEVAKLHVERIGKLQKLRWKGLENYKNQGEKDCEITKIKGGKDWEIAKLHMGRFGKFQKLRWVGLRHYKN